MIKLLAIAELDDEEISVRVHPAMIPAEHPLAAVRGASNAVFVEGPKIGQLMFYGAGAGGDPTATAVVGDLVSVARNLLQGARGPGSASTNARRVRPMDDTHDQYYLKLRVDDRPGVLAEIADRFGRNGISLERVWQEGSGDEATLSFITHRAQEGSFQKTMQELRELDAVHAVASMHPGGGRGVTSLDETPGSGAPQWRGIIEEYRARLPVSADTPVVTLREGGTPLVRSEVLSAETGCDVWLKYDGANPTGSFKDRGMTLAISKATRGGRESGRVRVHGQHERERGGVRGEGRPDVRGARARRARSRSARWPRRSCTAHGCSRSTATSTHRSSSRRISRTGTR